MVPKQLVLKKDLLKNDLIFPGAMWLGSRMVIWSAMLLIATLLGAPPGGKAATFGWDVFDAWDSIHYRSIATSGYEYMADGKGHNIAFFPLFPLIVRGVMSLGFPFEVAGTLVNNIAFIAALYCVYLWVKESHSIQAARWATAVLAWCPPSLFTAVIYTEGLYLLLSTMALRTFEEHQYSWTALCGAMATATRPTGIVLIPTFLIAAWKERRSPIAYSAALATSTGSLLFSVYCALEFDDPLAFIHAQRGWRATLGFDWLGWLKMLMQITVGTTNWNHGYLKNPLHPLLFAIIVALGYLLWRYRQQWGAAKVDYGFAILFLFLWILAGDPLINTVSVLGGAYLLWYLRKQLTLVTVIYGFCALGLILVSGGTWSLNRIAYGIVSLSIALGVLLSRQPRWGYLTMFFFAILLASFSVRFAQELWVG
ncbi:mannosyltransferase family protein [Chlorogloeopsis fritschii PCC 9212]|nr:mannosyltransferase family protein [Chlorogloeopsis fritschii]